MIHRLKELPFKDFKKEILHDYYLMLLSRQCSLLGRKEVLRGNAKFGVFGDGKELPQIVMAKYFMKGDWRSGYYRDQTFMMALGALTPHQFFAALYAYADIDEEPSSAGRQMVCHFATHSLDERGDWKDLSKQNNVSSDVSCTAGQMARWVGLGYASKLYREEDVLRKGYNKFSKNGNEISWGTIGNASTSEGHFFEAINAAGVLQIPAIINVWDDDYGISVSQKDHTVKESISEVLKGFQREDGKEGIEILKVNGWDYPSLIDTYHKASKIAREYHVPVVVHVVELTQPQGHSTSGSHERYKTADRLQWEKDFDCMRKMREWILSFTTSDADNKDLKIVDSEEELIAIENRANEDALSAKKEIWSRFITSFDTEKKELLDILEEISHESLNGNLILKIKTDLQGLKNPIRKDIYGVARRTLVHLRNENFTSKKKLQEWLSKGWKIVAQKYNSHILNDFGKGASQISEVPTTFKNEQNEKVDGRLILRDNFEKLFEKYPNLFVFGEDVGKIGDVNQGLEGLQEKFGPFRVCDTGIRETTIIGQGIGMALRGLRPIAEIQYIDYILYALQTLSDDLACMRYRTFGRQTAPLIVRTRGHRLEGIWHSGSPMSLLLSCLRGIHLLVPRNMTKAAGFYNTLLQSDEPAIVIENLNGYRLKEEMPDNLGVFCTPIGYSEVVKEGTDITLVSYGSTFKIVMEVAQEELESVGINAEVIDLQSLTPFDLDGAIVKSISKTNRFAIIDEDVPGGASAYILQKVIDDQDSYRYLDSKPICISAKEHRAPYGTDGDYFSKPSREDIFERIYEIFHETDPIKFPSLLI